MAKEPKYTVRDAIVCCTKEEQETFKKLRAKILYRNKSIKETLGKEFKKWKHLNDKIYNYKNKKHIKEVKKIYNKKNKKCLDIYKEEYRKNNYEKQKIIKKKWRSNNPNKVYKTQRRNFIKSSSSYSDAYLRRLIIKSNRECIVKGHPLIIDKKFDNKNTAFIFTLKKLLVIGKKLIYENKLNKLNKLNKQMKATVIKINKIKENVTEDISNMKELSEILLHALKNYNETKITKDQLMVYMHAGNITFKTIFAKFHMEQALITQE